MKKIITCISMLIMCITLTACHRENTRNIDTFILDLQNTAMIDIRKSDAVCEINAVYNIYDFYPYENILLSVYVNNKTSDITHIELTSEKCDEKFMSLSCMVFCALSGGDESEFNRICDELSKDIVKGENGFALQSALTEDFTYSLIKTSVGCKFTVVFNEEIPTQTTVTPESNYEFTYEVIRDTTKP